MSEFGCFVEVDPVTLAEGIHVHGVFALDLVCLPQGLEDMVPGCAFKLLGGQIWDSMLIFYLTTIVPTGSIIFLMSK